MNSNQVCQNINKLLVFILPPGLVAAVFITFLLAVLLIRSLNRVHVSEAAIDIAVVLSTGKVTWGPGPWRGPLPTGNPLKAHIKPLPVCPSRATGLPRAPLPTVNSWRR